MGGGLRLTQPVSPGDHSDHHIFIVRFCKAGIDGTGMYFAVVGFAVVHLCQLQFANKESYMRKKIGN